MVLMVGSQTAAWAWLIFTVLHVQPSVREGLGGLAVFHALWVVRNFLVLDRRERGMISYGVVACGCFFGHLSVTLLGVAMVWLSFLYVAYLLGVITWPASKLAHVWHQTLAWAQVFRLYICSNLAFWPAVAVLVVLV